MLRTVSKAWADINRPIYTGKRLKDNLRALSTISIFTALLGFALIILDYATHRMTMVLPSIATFLGGVCCAFCAAVLKKREIAVMIPTTFCVIAFTLYTVTGAAGGTAILWSMLMPIGLCYFVSVRCGILVSMYYIMLYFIVFYTPLRALVAGRYTDMFMVRFPLVFASMVGFTTISMVQYHRGVLLENEYAQRLHSEVERQTRVVREQADRLVAQSEEMVLTLAEAIDAKDRYTNGHSFRVSMYSMALAEKLGWTDEETRELGREALLHDIGKIGVPDSVLNKPGRLTEDEYKIIKIHTTVGGTILSRSAGLEQAAKVARHHHERYDGSGYPDGLSGSEIPLHARVVAIADAYDAMHSNRVYRNCLNDEIIADELEKGRGKQFDPLLLDVFYEMFKNGELDRIEQMKTDGEGLIPAI